MRKGRRVELQDLHTPTHWFPVALSDDSCTLWWRNLQGIRFTKPFFQDDLQAQPPHQRLVLQSPLSTLAEFAVPGRSVAPTAFIFHVSRCGSTLLTQMLATSERSIVMSEPPVVDAFFRYVHRQSQWSQASHFFRLLMATLGQRRNKLEQNFFVKFDSWHVPWIPFVREAFPETPIIFLYRDPSEVLASHQRQRGPQMVPGLLNTTRLHAVASDVAVTDLDTYCLRMLASMMELAHGYTQTANLMLLNYRQLPHVVWTELMDQFSMAYSVEDMQAVQSRARFHSKESARSFIGDAKCNTPAPTPVVQAALQAAQRHYQALETKQTQTLGFA